MALLSSACVALPDPTPVAEAKTLLRRTLSRAALAEAARIGIGGSSPLAEANVSYEQARTAVRIGGRSDQSVTIWEDHPLEGLLEAVLRTEVDDTAIPPMLGGQPDDTITVIRCFLDHGGNVAETAKTLHLHRATRPEPAPEPATFVDSSCN